MALIHNRKSIRLQGYDYSKAGLYFITICVQDRKCLFGKIISIGLSKYEISFNDLGKIAEKYWLEIPLHFPNAVLHEYVIMPNHIHGIIELVGVDALGVDDHQPIPTQPHRHEFQKMIPRSIGSIVKGFKIGVTKWFHKNIENEKLWQRNYYEHIIRDEASFHRISAYITNNPNNWNGDIFYME